ncbi:MAG: DUF2961 domain-containing protein [Verrucomicrobia bacterium]|nr:MAG: DUF2961 domain-containing protein [Verrucomicrobiota bacterium]
MRKSVLASVFAVALVNCGASAMELYKFDDNARSRWASFENIDAEKGQGGKSNAGAKGYPYHVLQPGETAVLLNVQGPGIVNRIWMTLDELFHKPEEMRSMRIDMYWDGCGKPAVSVPLADFFCAPLGRLKAFENELFASPEGRSFVSYIPMPYQTGARIEVVNESTTQHHRIFYDVNFTKLNKFAENDLYFHACWRRENPTTLGRDFEILPKVEGKGRFLGCNVGVVVDQRNLGWWGEGEAKIFMDDDGKYPTLCGTGTEDYIATGWGQGEFINRFHGSLVSDDEKGLYSFYRFHVPDPVQFRIACRVTIQQMGGTAKKDVKAMLEQGLRIKPVCAIIGSGEQCNFFGDTRYAFEDEQFEDGTWVNYYREDDFCATAYFYLDSPTNSLPVLVSVDERAANLK